MISRTAVRFASVGVVNTLLDLVLFMVLQPSLGITAANFLSTSAGIVFSFVVNGLITFGAGKLTLRHAALFLATNGVTMWIVQPLLIHALVWGFATTQGETGTFALLASKLFSVGGCLVLNFLAYRFLVWPHRPADPADRAPVDASSTSTRPVFTSASRRPGPS